MKTKETKDLIGTVVVDVGDTDKGEPDLDTLKNTENPDTVISAFCQACGAYHELSFIEAEKIFLALAQPLDFKNKYLIFYSCPLCKGEDKKVELKSF